MIHAVEGSQMRADYTRAIIEYYRRIYLPSFTSFLKRLTGYLGVALVVYLYGYPTTAAEVLMGLVAIDLILVLLLNSNG